MTNFKFRFRAVIFRRIKQYTEINVLTISEFLNNTLTIDTHISMCIFPDVG